MSEAQAANNDATRFVAAVKAEPAATPGVQAVKSLHLQEADFFLQATDDYLRGLRTRSQQLLDAGDAAMRQSDGYVRRTAQLGEALYNKLGGYSAFGNRIDFTVHVPGRAAGAADGQAIRMDAARVRVGAVSRPSISYPVNV